MDGWALMVAVLAFLVSAAALLIAWWQLAIQRDVAGGRGVVFWVHRLAQYKTKPELPEEYEGYWVPEWTMVKYGVHVELLGNPRHHVALNLQRHGVAIGEGENGYPNPLKYRILTGENSISWYFDVEQSSAEDLWCVLSWIEPFGKSIRHCALAQKLSGDRRIWVWRWRRCLRFRRWFEDWAVQHGPKWFRGGVGVPSRLGVWRPYRSPELQRRQTPLYAGVAPGTRYPLRHRLSWSRDIAPDELIEVGAFIVGDDAEEVVADGPEEWDEPVERF